MPNFTMSDLLRSLTHYRYNLKFVLDKLPIATAITDNRGVLVYYNQAQSHMDGIEAAYALGKKETALYDFLNFPDVHQICQKRVRPILGFVWPYRTMHDKTINAAYWVFPLLRDNICIGSLCFTQPVATALATGVKVKADKQPPIQWPDETPIALPQVKLVGGNIDFQRIMNTAKNTAASPSSVLIAGETGTGKELFARYIHESSPRAGKQFMAINCSAIPESLLEGLLFGTVKGSFTGAVDRAGLFEEANGGTLFLDEMDSMPLELQPKLLRAIQEMRVRRVGSSQEIRLDLKIISSVGGSLANALNSGRLRPDLFYRLAVIVIEIPSLRQRLDDLDALLNYFINKYNKQVGKQCCNFSEALMAYFRKYSWPGNIRELEHLVAGAINLSENEETLDYRHLPIHYQRMFTQLSQGDSEHSTLGDIIPGAFMEEFQADEVISFIGQALSDTNIAKGSLPDTPSQETKFSNEKDRLCQALKECQGNVAEAARRLNLSRQGLAYKMKKYALNREDFCF